MRIQFPRLAGINVEFGLSCVQNDAPVDTGRPIGIGLEQAQRNCPTEVADEDQSDAIEASGTELTISFRCLLTLQAHPQGTYLV